MICLFNYCPKLFGRESITLDKIVVIYW